MFYGAKLPELGRLKEFRQVKTIKNSSVNSAFNIPGLEKIIHSSNNWHKFIWIASLLAFYGLCTYQLVNLVTFYFTSPVALDISIKKFTSVEVPSVTVCPSYGMNIFTYKLLRINKLSMEDVVFAESNFTAEDVWNESSITKDEVGHLSSCSEAEAGRNNTLYQKNYGKCGEKVQMLKEPFPTFWGNCLRMTPTARLNYRGAWTYVSFHVNRYVKDYIDIEALKIGFNITTHAAQEYSRYFLRLENQTVFIPHLHNALLSHEIAKQYYKAEKGSKVTVNFLLKRFIFLNRKENPCVAKEVSIQCKESCLENRLLSSVNCSLPYMEKISRPTCESYYEAFVAQLIVEREYKEFDNCNCPRACDETVISYTSDYLTGNADITIFSLNFPDNAVQTITERFAYPFSALLSDIGGNLGFCVGLCLFSFVEIIMGTLQPITRWLRKKGTRNRGRKLVVVPRNSNGLIERFVY